MGDAYKKHYKNVYIPINGQTIITVVLYRN